MKAVSLHSKYTTFFSCYACHYKYSQYFKKRLLKYIQNI